MLVEESARDAAVSARLAELAPSLSPAQLDVNPVFLDARFNRWAAAAAELRQLDSRRTPRGKMDCVLRCVLQLKEGLVECLSAQVSPGPHPSPQAEA